jgi:hypothetical protein
MGSQMCLNGRPTIRARVATTAPLDRLVLLRGKEVIYTHQLPNQARLDPAKIRVEWSGARIKTRFRSTVWHGSLHLDGGKILCAEPFAFDSPWEGITHADAHDVSWRSHTNGDPDGVILHLDEIGGQNGTLTFTTDPATFTCSLADLENGPIIVEAGGIDQKVTVSRLPVEDGPMEAEFEYDDAAPTEGTNAYWIRLRQADGEEAWSSPVYVEG